MGIDSQTPLRIANIIEEGKLGGPQIRMVAVAAALKDRVDTTIIMPQENSDSFRKRCDEQGIDYVTFSISRITKDWRVALRYLFFSLYEIAIITRYLKKQEFDLVHVSGGSWQYKGVIAGKLASVKVLWHLNDTSTPGFIRRIFSLLSRLADGFVFASERSKAYYAPAIKEKKIGFVIPAPVDTSEFDPQNEYPGEEALLEKWQGKFVIGTVANVNPVKGLETFIHTAALLNKQSEDFVFVVVGQIYPAQKKYYASLQKLIQQLGIANLDFSGAHLDVRPFLKRFDAYVCSSNAESSPISVWEAMAMAKPIVSTHVGDVPLYVQDKVNGFIVDVGDSDAMAERLHRLVQDQSMRKLFGDRSREVAIHKLDVSQCADRHFKAYNAILSP